MVSALSDASLAWALVSFLTVIGIGFFSASMVKMAGSKDLNNDHIAQDLNISFRYATLFGGIIITSSAALTFNACNSSDTANIAGTKVLAIVLLYLPATYIQLTVFNFFNAIREAHHELASTWFFNLTIITAGVLLIVIDTNPEIIYSISIYVTLKWIYAALALRTFSRNIRVHIPSFSYRQHISRASYANYFLKGVPLALCLGGESLLFFIFTFISKILGDKSLAAYQASLHFLSIVYMISIGVGNATGIIIARHFTSKEFLEVRKVYLQGMTFGLLVLTPLLIVSFLFKNHIALLYTSELCTRRLIENNILISIPFLLFEYIYIITRMTLRSMGDFWVPTLLTISILNIFGLAASSSLLLLYKYHVSSIFLTLVLCALILMLLLLNRLTYIFRSKTQSDF